MKEERENGMEGRRGEQEGGEGSRREMREEPKYFRQVHANSAYW